MDKKDLLVARGAKAVKPELGAKRVDTVKIRVAILMIK